MFEAYSVAVKLSLIDAVTGGLIRLAGQFSKTHGSAVLLQSQLNKIRFNLMAGGALLGAGAFGFWLIDKAVKPATEYAHQLEQMRISGMKNLEIARATRAAWDAANVVPTSSVTENLAAIRELRMVFGNTEHAIANMPAVQQLQAILQNTKGGAAKDEAYTVAKALEMKGAVKTPGEFHSQANLMTKAIVASGGKVSAGDFLSAFKYGRSATIGWSDQFTYSILPTLIQEMKSGGSGGVGGPGNALMSAYSAVVGGTIPQKALKVWARLGLLDPSKVVWTKAGEAKGVGPGGIRGSDLFQADPFAWAQKVLVPALAKKGITDDKSVRQTMQYLFPNRTAGFVMQQMAMQGWKFERDQKLIKGASGLNAYNHLLKNDPVMASVALQKQWNSLLAIVGYQIMPVLVKATLGLIGVLRSMSQWAAKHQTLTKVLVVAFAALSAAMVFGGTVLLLTAAFQGIAIVLPILGYGFGMILGVLSLIASPIGLVVAGLVLLGTAIYEIWKHWDSTKSVWENMKNIIGGFFSWIWAKVKWLVSWIPGMGGDDQPSKFVPRTNKGKGGVGNVYMDGKKVGQVVTGHQTAAANKAASSGSTFDPTRSLAHASSSSW